MGRTHSGSPATARRAAAAKSAMVCLPDVVGRHLTVKRRRDATHASRLLMPGEAIRVRGGTGPDPLIVMAADLVQEREVLRLHG